MDSTKVAFEEFLKHRKETANKSEQILNKNVRNFIKIKKDIFNHSNGNFAGKVFDNVFKQTAQTPVVQKRCDSPREDDSKPYPVSCKPTVAPKTVSEHNCKHEEEVRPSVCQGHTCDHHKESKKCDCTYCEVFGTSVTSHTHKNNVLRDRLRIRLHQRRKEQKDTCKTPPNPDYQWRRVPLPSSPTNIPPAPSVKSSDSSITTSSAPDDIHGLVNYIEGNTALNKMELAQKKPQRRRDSEEDRIKAEEEAKRIAEELKKKEGGEEGTSEKDGRKGAKQICQGGKEKGQEGETGREEAAGREARAKKGSDAKNKVLEETIPAMVTIKRVAENGTSAPTVAITLKGSTPDQDKLLYTLKIQSPTVIAKELKVTLAVDSNKSNAATQDPKKVNKGAVFDDKKSTGKQKEKKEYNFQEDVHIPMLAPPTRDHHY
ncbi:hypothetical protein NQ318_001746 [Aromia moschata]|uniref:Uncharacterized protein n=1 Tax=Aromia moschata TaxID=1265417 RepID=A0AAV8XS40_9CUCU|nr:hypothetical protein NQ318_001746 [Aromia moschata]